jgi:hypothetical protein
MEEKIMRIVSSVFPKEIIQEDIKCEFPEIQFEFYRFSTEDSHFKECEGRGPMSKWEMNVGWR